ncbi:hypothetical protein L1049_014957 [Liquidambar formosana]|uniref:Uncharacterized protein n=1 Tax=Liquidambar formosana TaxID=63359 RepID=A0AAP0RY54_LIQFO
MSSNSSICLGCACLHLLLLLLLSGNAVSHNIVKTLPGFSGELPFKLETGYVSVGDVEFFYYFVESEGNPGADPLLLYINGGPGCSGLNGFFYQIGPLAFNITDYTGGLPQLLYMKHAWTRTASIIFIDAPVGAGFSYATTTSAYASTDTLMTAQAYSFMKNWLSGHPDFMTNPFFIGSDSYAGIYVPMLAQTIIEGNEAGEEPQVNLKGYSIGCPHTYTTLESNTKITFAHRMALVSDGLYWSAKRSCNGSYVDVDANNTQCVEDLEAISLCTQQISSQHILEPNCAFLSPKPNEARDRRILEAKKGNSRISSPKFRDLWCRNFNYLLSDIWTNYKSVQAALHVRPGTVKRFFRCNVSLDYTVDVNNVVPYHKNLTVAGLQVLVFSGDHDMVIPHIGVEQWISSLDLTVDSDWRPWFIQGQVAGELVTPLKIGMSFADEVLAGRLPQNPTGGLQPSVANVAFSGSIVKYLPGFDGELPFKLETGYVTVEESELFYYFIESEGNPKEDPLILWYSGGPGCSTINGLIYEVGPLAFNITAYDGGIPPLQYYPYSWTRTSSILFVDAPVGTGFSYATSLSAYPTSDTKTAAQNYEFLRKWLTDHPQFLKVQLFIGADSYAGISATILVQDIVDGNKNGLLPHLNLKGYLLGCPRTDATINDNSKIIFSHRLALISDELYESAKNSCGGNYDDVEVTNPQCYEDIQLIDKNFNYALSYIWANDETVQNALHIRNGTVPDWKRCNKTLDYSMDVSSVLDYHRNLSKLGLQVLIYNGDHDLTIPNVGTQKWITELNLTIVNNWRPWFVDGQIAGYTIKYSGNGYRLTYASVKGAGHSPQEYKRRECFDMFDRWIHYYPI